MGNKKMSLSRKFRSVSSVLSDTVYFVHNLYVF